MLEVTSIELGRELEEVIKNKGYIFEPYARHSKVNFTTKNGFNPASFEPEFKELPAAFTVGELLAILPGFITEKNFGGQLIRQNLRIEKIGRLYEVYYIFKHKKRAYTTDENPADALAKLAIYLLRLGWPLTLPKTNF